MAIGFKMAQNVYVIQCQHAFKMAKNLYVIHWQQAFKMV